MNQQILRTFDSEEALAIFTTDELPKLLSAGWNVKFKWRVGKSTTFLLER